MVFWRWNHGQRLYQLMYVNLKFTFNIQRQRDSSGRDPGGGEGKRKLSLVAN